MIKNKFIAGLLVFIICLCQLSVTALSDSDSGYSSGSGSEYSSDYTIYIYDYTIHKGSVDIKANNKPVSGDLNITAKVNNDTVFDANNIAVIAAVYDSENKVLAFDNKNISVSKNSSTIVSDILLSVPDVDLTNAKIKLFVWNNLNTMVPLMNKPIVFPETFSNLTVYPAPEGINASDKYSVRLSEDDGATWKNSFTYMTECLDKSVDSAYYSDYIGGFTASFTNFEIKNNAPIKVEITKLWGDPIKTADVKPHSQNISNIIDGNKVIFTITEPALLTVEIDGYPNDGKKDHSICIFANAPQTDVPDKNDPSVKVLYPGDEIPQYTDDSWTTLYFTPGVYNIGVGYTVAPNKKYYIAGGAYVTGTFADYDPVIRDGSTRLKVPPNGSGAKVYGYGIISSTGINWLDGGTNPNMMSVSAVR